MRADDAESVLSCSASGYRANYYYIMISNSSHHGAFQSGDRTLVAANPSECPSLGEDSVVDLTRIITDAVPIASEEVRASPDEAVSPGDRAEGRGWGEWVTTSDPQKREPSYAPTSFDIIAAQVEPLNALQSGISAK